MNIVTLQARFERSAAGQYWNHLSPRDRLALGGLSLFLLVVVLYLSIWRPIAAQVDQARASLQQQRSLNAYLEANAERARAAAGHSPSAAVEPARLPGVVTASAAAQGLSVERLDSQGDGGVQVTLQATEFARLLRWISELDGQGVRVDEAGIERADKGLVTSRLLLRSGA
ncbi:type II secretion system protein M [Pseudomonas sp. LRF_L74]|uniref:type II secretion system protein M n=1 Tax=Pseudomonas sp. LRF_L74 TaxID=3369422 RepID=UPI003F5ED5F0